MGADNWTFCPACYKKVESRVEQVKKTYGKVSADEYETALAKAKKEFVREDPTFREDWDLGCFNGKFYVNYTGSCGSCGYKKEFHHEEKVP